jgi:hypothetical protein
MAVLDPREREQGVLNPLARAWTSRCARTGCASCARRCWTDKGGSGELTLALLGRKGRRFGVAARQEHGFTVDDSNEETGESSSVGSAYEEVGS